MKPERKRVLVVDDEPKIIEVVKAYLETRGFEVCEAKTGLEALEQFDRIDPCLIILDLMLPDVSGEEVCGRIRKKSRVPVIMLTAKVEDDEVVQGLALGADDYVTKPFSPRQLMARVDALLRRTAEEAVPLSDLLSFHDGDLLIDRLRHEVKKAGMVVNLTPNEYGILMTMIKYPQKVFTREELIAMALGADYDGFDRTIDSHIKNLRQKIENNTKTPRYILTVHGIGYRFGGE